MTFGSNRRPAPARGRRQQRSLRSAFSWAIVLPFTLLTATAVTRQPFLLLVLPAAYLLQIARISRNVGAAGKSKWIDATLIQIAKVAEAMGALQYFAGGRPARAFDYKLPG